MSSDIRYRSKTPQSRRQHTQQRGGRFSSRQHYHQQQGETPRSKKINTRLYKTNLCRTYTKMGSCPYGAKCQFAHGEDELKPIPRDLDDRLEDDEDQLVSLNINSPFNVTALYAGSNNARICTPRAPVLASPTSSQDRIVWNQDDDDDEEDDHHLDQGLEPMAVESCAGQEDMKLELDFSSPPPQILKLNIDIVKKAETPSSLSARKKFSLKLNLPLESPRVLNLSSTKNSIQSPRISMLNLSLPNAEKPIPDGARVDCDPRLYKTELCRSYSQHGSCRYGEKCQFAHGIEELRPAPQRIKRDGSPSSPRGLQRPLSVEPKSPRIVRLQIEDDAKFDVEEEKLDRRLQMSPTNFKSPRIKDPRVYKTELCKKFETMGECPYGMKCQFAHGVEELRPRLPLTTTNASFLESMASPKGSPDPRLYKTELCRSFNKTGYCRYGLKCQFAHGIKELRPSPRVTDSEEQQQRFRIPSPTTDLSVLNDTRFTGASPRNLTVSPIVGSPRRQPPSSAPSRSKFTFHINEIEEMENAMENDL